MSTITMVCMGGEKDGLELSLSDDDAPDLYFALPNADEDKIKKTRGNEAKRELQGKYRALLPGAEVLIPGGAGQG